MTFLTIQNLHKAYGQLSVLHNVSIDLEEGGFLVLVGPSGCGKSTLLNCLAGLEEITSGQILLNGQNMVSQSPSERDIAMVFQSYALYPTMSVSENIAFGLEMRKVPKAQRQQQVQDVAKMLQIEHLLNRRPGQLSGGQRQRVAMGRALVRNPKMFLFDEPLSNLDARLRVDMRTEIKRLHQKLGTTMIYVTHDQIEAMTLATKIAVMKGGILQQLASPDEIYNRPANLFVAEFMGSPAINLITGQLKTSSKNSITPSLNVKDRNGKAISDIALKQVGLNGSMPNVGSQIVMGIRSEDIGLDTSKPDSIILNGTCDVIEPTGADQYIIFSLWEGQQVIARMPSHSKIKIGEIVPLALDTHKIHLFDQITGNRL